MSVHRGATKSHHFGLSEKSFLYSSPQLLKTENLNLWQKREGFFDNFYAEIRNLWRLAPPLCVNKTITALYKGLKTSYPKSEARKANHRFPNPSIKFPIKNPGF
jgi:hypothetical protein